jgi:hypothetical protein
MPAKSFLGETREAAHRFYAMTIRGEVSDENIQAYMRAASRFRKYGSKLTSR